MRAMNSAPSRRVPVIGGDLVLILAISLVGLLVTAWVAAVAPEWAGVFNAWAWL